MILIHPHPLDKNSFSCVGRRVLGPRNLTPFHLRPLPDPGSTYNCDGTLLKGLKPRSTDTQTHPVE